MSNEIKKWADPAMFKAEDMPDNAQDGPKVHLIWMTPDPLGAAAALNAMYTGKVVRSLSDVTDAEREHILTEMKATALKTPLEAIKLHFMIEGVTRAFTHQLVRTRTAAFAQESMRFAVLGQDSDIPVQLPPSLAGTVSEDEWYSADNPECKTQPYGAQRDRLVWDDAIHRVEDAYRYMINNGMPAEDARGILPTNIKTRINMVIDLRALLGLAGVRLCTQAQFEWRTVFTQIAQAIHDYDPTPGILKSLLSDGKRTTYYGVVNHIVHDVKESDRWQYEAIAKSFRPICYMTGKCEFKATADRSCTIRNRVDANAAIGRPSSQWHKNLHWPISVGDDMAKDGPLNIAAISPAEWMLDPTAAR